MKKGSESDNGSTTVASIERAADVLLFMASAATPTAGVTEIASSLGISKAVVHRTLSSLRERGFVEVDEETRRYRLGVSALKLGSAYLDRLDIRSLAQQPMRRLVDQTGETATLSIRDNWHRFYIDQVTPALEVKMTVQLGMSFPLHAGASSKAFLSFLSAPEIDEYLGRSKLEALTSSTVTSKPDLREELRTIRERGYARSLGERQSGAASVAAPVFNQHRRPVAVLSVSGPIERFSERMDDAARALLEETTELSRLMGCEPSAPA